MNQTIYFPIAGYEAVATDAGAQLRLGTDVVITMTFFDHGVFTVREPGRGHAGRFPATMGARDYQAKVAYALESFSMRSAA